MRGVRVLNVEILIRPPKLGIALGSGSARGWAHIGVLSALAEQGIAPEFVAGCSMGAMVGAAFAAGRIQQLEKWALSLDWRRVVRLLDVGLRGGLIKGDRLVNLFQGQFVESRFSELMLPFAAVATDLASGKELWLREGKVSDAVRASCTVPGLFQPVLRDGRYVVDGSVVNPIPVSLCRAMGAEVVIAVDLGSHKDRLFPLEPQGASEISLERPRLSNVFGPSKRPEVPGPPSIIDTLLRTIDVMQERIAQARLLSEPPDVLITPRLGQLGPFEYYRADMAIAEGRNVVAQMLPAIRQRLQRAVTTDSLSAER
jgi:NTE family protein